MKIFSNVNIVILKVSFFKSYKINIVFIKIKIYKYHKKMIVKSQV